MTLKRIIISSALIISVATCLCPVATQAAQGPAQGPFQGPDFTQVAEKAIPAVVSIKVQILTPSAFGNSEEMPYEDPFHTYQDDFLRKFFRMPQQMPSRPQMGQGSGFIVRADGTILTNNHIVRSADKIIVTLTNGKEYLAKVIGKDPSSDIAIIKIDAQGLPTLKLGNSDELRVGQWVAAVGNPAGLQATLTHGIVSAKERTNLGLTQYDNFIQTDAPINLGNSGGPLLNLNGEVIGINAAIAAHTAGYDGIGFAIPSSMAQNVMEQLLTDGTVTRSYIGITPQQIDSDMAEAFNLKEISGIVIADVKENSPAEKAKLQPGDIILKLNERPVNNPDTFRNMISMMKPGTKIALLIKRGSREFPVTIEVAPHPDNLGSTEQNREKLGIQVEALTQEQAKRLGYLDVNGVIISKVEGGSLASLVGLKKGALIMSVNNRDVKNPEEFNAELKNIEEGKPVVLRIKQEGVTAFVSLRGF